MQGAIERDAEQRVRRFESVAKVARRKLRQLEIANRLDDMRVPPGPVMTLRIWKSLTIIEQDRL